MMDPVETQKRVNQRWATLKSERDSWVPQWRELSQFILPRSGRFFLQDQNLGAKRHNSILDNTGTGALRVLAAGMMAGMTSPARPWFRLATSDPELNEAPAVKQWLSDVSRQMLDIFAKSNTYRALHAGYEELAVFGSMVSIVEPDYYSIIHHHPQTAGTFAMAENWKGEIDTVYREFRKSVGSVVQEFGIENCSTSVKNLHQRGMLDSWVPIIHAIEPRKNRDPSLKDARNMAWSSVYFESGRSDNSVLREGGYEKFPALAARWATSGGDVYGNSPAMDALGDIKQLQHEQMRKAQGIDFMTKPPLSAPPGMKEGGINQLPGGVTFMTGVGKIEPIFDVRLNLEHLLADIQDVRGRIRNAFHADLFLMLANSSNTNMTATEVAERHEEKLLMLGPVIERLHSELLSPKIEATFEAMIKAGIVAPPPEELQNMELNVVFISMLAQAQRAVATNSVDRFVNTLGSVAAFKPEVLDNFDADQWAVKYSDMLGVDPDLVVPSDQVAFVRQQRAQAAQQQQQLAAMEQAASAAQKAGTIQTQNGNVISDAISAFSGYS